jgi:hypothetical protein
MKIRSNLKSALALIENSIRKSNDSSSPYLNRNLKIKLDWKVRIIRNFELNRLPTYYKRQWLGTFSIADLRTIVEEWNFCFVPDLTSNIFGIFVRRWRRTWGSSRRRSTRDSISNDAIEDKWKSRTSSQTVNSFWWKIQDYLVKMAFFF